MKYEECPYCNRISASYWSLGNAAFLFNTDKKCPHCFGRIRIDLKSYLIVFLTALVWLILFLIVGYIFKDKINNVGIYLLFFILLHVIIDFQVALFSRYWNLKMFLPKDDVTEHMKDLPSYLK